MKIKNNEESITVYINGKQKTIESYVKKVKIKEGALYNSNLEITVLMNDGKRLKFKTTGAMTVGDIVNAIIERVEE